MLFREARFAADFTRGLYRVDRAIYPCMEMLPGWTFSRASQAYACDAGGHMHSFASGVARRTNRGYLSEAARTNLLLRSQEFDNASWTKAGASVSANAATAPTGELAADKLVEDTSAGLHRALQDVTATTSVAHTGSIIAKAGERSVLTLIVKEPVSGSGAYARFNLATGAIHTAVTTLVSGASASAGVEALAGGFYRCWVSVTPNGGGTLVRTEVQINDGSTDSYTGDGASGLYLFGAQLEAATGASSYIATTSASVTRAADVAGAAFAIQFPFTVLVEWSLAFAHVFAVANTAVNIDNGSSAERIQVYLDGVGRGVKSNIITGGASQGIIGSTAVATVGAVERAAIAYAANDHQMYAIGVESGSDASVTAPAASAHIRFGCNQAGAVHLNGNLRRLAVIPGRLSNLSLLEAA